MKITFMGAGSTVFARNVLGDCMCTPALCEAEIALYDINEERLKDSEIILGATIRMSTSPEPRSKPISVWKTEKRLCGMPTL